MTTAPRVFPFSPDGAAMRAPMPSGAVTLSDLTPCPRFGLKGFGSAAWLAGQGVALPEVNRIGTHGPLRILRLGGEDFVLLSQTDSAALDRLRSAWRNEEGPRGYASWRDEGWAWMHVAGHHVVSVMRRLCAIDLRTNRFAPDAIVQTRVAQVETVLFRSGSGFDLLFDITMSAFFVRAVVAAAEYTDDDIAGNEAYT